MPCNLTEPHQILGSLYIAHGGTYLILYLPSLIVIFKKQLYKMSCYKIMIFMGLLDVLNLCSNALLAGYYSIIGRNYCEGDKFMPSIGAAALGMWAAYCASCVLLGFNRYIDLRSQHLSSILFDGKRLYLWLAVPVSYGLFFASPALPPVGYSADLGVWFIMGDSLFHSINNFLTCSLLIALYILIVGLLWRKMRANSSHNVSVMQKQVFLQSVFICSMTMVACISYIVIQVAPVPPAFYKFTQFSWQACHGANAVVYLTLNKTIRSAVVQYFKCHTTTNTFSMTTAIVNLAPRTIRIQSVQLA